MEKSHRKKLLNLLLLAVVFGLTVWAVFHGEDPKELLAYLRTAEPGLVVLSVVCVLGFILGEAWIIRYLMGCLGVPVRRSHCCLYSFIGFFYSCITPSASGGQPMQVAIMRRDGIPVAVSTVVLAIVTITYKLVLVVVGIVVLALRPARIMALLDPVLPVVWLGLGLNVVCVALLLLLVFHPTLVERCARWALGLLHRLRPFREMHGYGTTGWPCWEPEWEQAHLERLERMIGQYSGAAEFYRSHKHVVVHVFLMTVLQRTLLFLITWFTYRAFGLSGEGPVFLTSLQAMISVAVDMLPLPGGMGISETLFLTIFEPVFGPDLILPAMVVSRGVSYYSQLLLSAAMTAAASFILGGKRKKKEAPTP